MMSLFYSFTLPYCKRSSAVRLAILVAKAVSKAVMAVVTAVFSVTEKCRLSKFVKGIVFLGFKLWGMGFELKAKG